MDNGTVSLFSFIGGVVVFVLAVTGAYPWLRWGWTGVAKIWSVRRVLDMDVSLDVEEAMIQDAEKVANHTVV